MMAHCKPDELQDISDVLDGIRALDLLKEKKVGIFYLKSKGFLHFHSKGKERWADVRDGLEWGTPIFLKFNPTRNEKVTFLKEVKKRYQTSIH